MIHSYQVSDVYSWRHIPLWLASSFKSGFINSAGFLITGKFVSHVTGFGTQIGVALGHEDYFFGVELLVIPVSFILGAVITSFTLDKDYAVGETPPYWKVQMLITIFLLIVIAISEYVFAAHIQIPFDTDNNYNLIELAMISLLCLVCGLKNGLVTWSTFGKIRVTHLTGLSTDIGLNLIGTLFPSHAGPRFKEERFINILRLFTFCFFSAGALISALLYPKFGLKILFIPVAMSICMLVMSILDSRRRVNL